MKLFKIMDKNTPKWEFWQQTTFYSESNTDLSCCFIPIGRSFLANSVRTQMIFLQTDFLEVLAYLPAISATKSSSHVNLQTC